MMEGIIGQTYLGNKVFDYLICLGICVGGFLVVKMFELVVLVRLKKIAEKTSTSLDDFFLKLVKKIVVPLAYFGVFYLGFGH